MAKRPRDLNQLAKMIVDESTGDARAVPSSKASAAAVLGRLGGLKGGRARADNLSADQRSAIAKRAAAARWANKG